MLTSLCLVEWALIKLITTIVVESNGFPCSTEKEKREVGKAWSAWGSEKRVQMEAKGYRFCFLFAT